MMDPAVKPRDDIPDMWDDIPDVWDGIPDVWDGIPWSRDDSKHWNT